MYMSAFRSMHTHTCTHEQLSVSTHTLMCVCICLSVFTVAGKMLKKKAQKQTTASSCGSESQMLELNLPPGSAAWRLLYHNLAVVPALFCNDSPTANQLSFQVNNVMHGETSETASADV